MWSKSVFTVLTCLLFNLQICFQAIAQNVSFRQTVRIVTEGAHPPFNFQDEFGNLKGFEIDLAKALCDTANLNCTVTSLDWESLIPALLNNKADAIISTLTITSERQTKIDFSKRYYFIPHAFMARKDTTFNNTSPYSLKGRSIGAVAHSDAANFLQDKYPDSILRFYSNLEEVNLDLVTERIELVLGERMDLGDFLKRNDGSCCQIVGNALTDPDYFDKGAGIGLRKTDQALKKRFDLAIDQIIANGTYDRIRQSWIDFDIR